MVDLSAEIRSALEAASLTAVTVSAIAYGENCITRTCVVDHFAAMETDFRIRMEAPDLSDTAALGDLLEQYPVRSLGISGYAPSTEQRKSTCGLLWLTASLPERWDYTRLI